MKPECITPILSTSPLMQAAKKTGFFENLTPICNKFIPYPTTLPTLKSCYQLQSRKSCPVEPVTAKTNSTKQHPLSIKHLKKAAISITCISKPTITQSKIQETLHCMF